MITFSFEVFNENYYQTYYEALIYQNTNQHKLLDISRGLGQAWNVEVPSAKK